MKQATTATVKRSAKRTTKAPDDRCYAPFLRGVEDTFTDQTRGVRALLTVDTTSLWETYLAAFPKPERQVYTCSACKQFVQRYGGLVTVTESGDRVSAVWNLGTVNGIFVRVAERMRTTVERLPVASAFITTAGVIGTPMTGEWAHLHATVPQSLARTSPLLTANQIAAGIRENVATVERALEEFPLAAVAEALRVLEADALSRAEKFIGPVKWLHDLHVSRAATKDERKRAAILWQAVATSPEGYSHPRASVVGPLLEGIIAGKSFTTLCAEFSAMLHPLRYQRPQAHPSAGNIAEGERVVAALGLAPSLERRFARLDECETIWVPTIQRAPANSDGVFAHLAPKAAPPASLHLPTQTMTWEKFHRTILPTAQRIELYVPVVGPFMALTTAENSDAPPIIRWDHPERRNAVSWYVYHGKSTASQWRLMGNAWCALTGIVPLPNLWGPAPTPQHGEGYVLILNGAVDTRASGLALFPEHLRDEVRSIRSTIEEFSRRGTLSGRAEGTACGLDVRKGSVSDCRLRVMVDGKSAEYVIDRWD